MDVFLSLVSFSRPRCLALPLTSSHVQVVDRSNNNLAVWETGSILRYIAEKYDTEHKLHFDNIEEETELYNWLFFQQ
jgi:hypothetical protein